MTARFIPRIPGDIQTAVVTLVDRLAPVVPVARQPYPARKIAEVIATRPSSMARDMFLRQSIIRRGTATHDHVVDGLAAWVTVLFDLGNLRHDRSRALGLRAAIPDEALVRLTQALSRSRNGCILAFPHIGSIELSMAHLKDRGFDIGFVFTIGARPTPTERWIYEGRIATHATPIPFGRRYTGAGISTILRNGGVVFMVVDRQIQGNPRQDAWRRVQLPAGTGKIRAVRNFGSSGICLGPGRGRLLDEHPRPPRLPRGDACPGRGCRFHPEARRPY
jgi:hypothetical protein